LQQRLLHDFYQIEVLTHSAEGACEATLSLNAEHPIFDGHFPGFPVVPGVCMMQITKELLEQALGCETRLVAARNLKFLTILNPNENKIIRSELKYHREESGNIEVENCLLDSVNGTVFFKMKGTFCIS
jgi:3-hydroxyacyl-[acyl-carrier-protein] dehydratase